MQQTLPGSGTQAAASQHHNRIPANARPARYPAALLHTLQPRRPFSSHQQQPRRVLTAVAAAVAAPEKPRAQKKKPAFPFARIAGQDDMKLALLLNVVDPGIGGVLVMGDRGTGKSVAVSGPCGSPSQWPVASTPGSDRLGGSGMTTCCITH